MRYSFHGKVRATGQQVDGFVEAATATLAIDRLADKGIIGVYSVRPEPKPPRHAVTVGLDGAAKDDADDARSDKGDRRAPKALPAALQAAPQIAPPASAGVALPSDQATAELLKQLVDKIAALTTKVEAVLARPASVVYQNGASGPARGASGMKKPRVIGEMQNTTLRDIFQNNLDLRQSLEKLATTVGPASAKSIAVSAIEVSAKREIIRENTNGSHGPSLKPRDLVNQQAQPAA